MKSPNTGNYTLGKGVVYLDNKNMTTGVYDGERDLGNAPAFTFNIALEKLEHFSSRGGLKAKDKEIISQITPSVRFSLDEINKENLAMLTLGSVEEVTQAAGGAIAEAITAHLGKRSDLAHRELGFSLLPYDGGTVLFVVGETVTGAAGATGAVLAVTGDATTGTLTIATTNAIAFVDDETLTGDAAGAADVNSATGAVAGTGNPIVLVQDSANAITYVAGTDYAIEATLKDGMIGRIKVLDGGSIAEGDILHVTYQYSASTYSVIKAIANTQIEGKLRFVSDNPAGTQQELVIWRCSLTPDGDTAMISDDWSTLSFAGEILKDDVNHPDSPYMNMIMA